MASVSDRCRIDGTAEEVPIGERRVHFLTRALLLPAHGLQVATGRLQVRVPEPRLHQVDASCTRSRSTILLGRPAGLLQYRWRPATGASTIMK